MKFLRAGVAAGLLAWAAVAGAQGNPVRISCGAVGQELELCRSGALAWAGKTGHAVEVIATPANASDRLALYQQVLASRSDRIDVFQIDVVWPGLLANHLADLLAFSRGEEKQHVGALIANNTVRGRLVAMPWFTNAGLLFYRKDLLEKHGHPVPQTWTELERTARAIQDAERAAGNRRMWGYVWQGRAYEGLTCNAFEWLVSHGAGTIVDAQGRITARNAAATTALQRAAAWVGSITPQAVLNYAEEDARGTFQSGNAVFMRNWAYAWSLAQSAGSPVKDRVGIAVLPRAGQGGRHAATLGGESLAVSRYSRQPALAADLVLHLTGAAVQKQRALEGSFNPTRPALYRDADVLARNPFMGELAATIETAVARPAAATGARYNQVSNEFWNTVHTVLSGTIDADTALLELERRLTRISRGERWK